MAAWRAFTEGENLFLGIRLMLADDCPSASQRRDDEQQNAPHRLRQRAHHNRRDQHR